MESIRSNILVVFATATTAVLLSGCAEHDGNLCIGKACVCNMQFADTITIFGMELTKDEGMRYEVVEVPDIDKQYANATIQSACCLAATAVAKTDFENTPNVTDVAKLDVAKFCSKCKNSPNEQIQAAIDADVCPKPQALLGRDVERETVQSPSGFADYQFPCSRFLFGEEANVTINGVVLPLAHRAWMFQNESNTSACCRMLNPVIYNHYVNHRNVSAQTQSDFCQACHNSSNVGILRIVSQKCASKPEHSIKV